MEVHIKHESTYDYNLGILNSKIEALELFLIEQDQMSPLEDVCFIKPSDQNPLDFYKEILLAYTPFHQKDLDTLCVKAYASLARTHLSFVKKRTLYKKCTNLDSVKPDTDAVIKIINKIIMSSFSVSSNNLINGLERITTIEPIIETMNEKTEYDRAEKKKKEAIFLPYFQKFETEIDQAVLLNKTHYRWFMIFSDQLSLLTSNLLYKSFNIINTNYPVYLEYVDRQRKFPNFFETKYLTGLQRQNTALSLPGLLNQFPSIFLMPYPFTLEPLDFINLGVGNNQLFWPCGMIFRPAPADSWYHCPRMFFGHDWHHLGILLSSMITPTIFADRKKDFLNTKLISNIIFCAQNSFTIYNLLMREIYENISKLKDSEQQKMFSFFAFYGFHEGLLNMKNRIKTIFAMKQEDFKESSYYENTYYRSLYPKTTSQFNKSELKTYLTLQFADYQIFCHQFITSKTRKIAARFLNHYPKGSGNLFYLYSIQNEKNALVGHSNSKDPSHPACEINYFCNIIFKNVCSSPENCLLLISIDTNCTITEEEWESSWKKGLHLYDSLKDNHIGTKK